MTVEVYLPSVNKWKRVADMPYAACSDAVASLRNAFYVLGYSTHAKYDLVSDTWQQIAPLNQPRTSLALVELNGSIIYAFGGYPGGVNVSSTTEQYDAQRNAWTTIAPLSVARQHVAGCVWQVSARDALVR